MVSGHQHDYKHAGNLFHLTTFENILSILQHGLMSRHELDNRPVTLECDIANEDIIDFREEHNITKYIPFHFIMHSPFAGDVMTDPYKCDHTFIYIVISRQYARKHNFKIIPKHPMCKEYKKLDRIPIYDYQEGIEKIDWDNVNKRDFRDYDSKIACLAECVSEEPLNIFEMMKNGDASLAVKTEMDRKNLISICSKLYGQKYNCFFQNHIWKSKFF